MSVVSPLQPSDLFKACSEASLFRDNGARSSSSNAVVGQQRAIQAVDFAVGMPADGHNLFILGPPGTGRKAFIRQRLIGAAADQPDATDWCYVNNFDDPHCPIAIELPAGMGRLFATTVADCIEELQSTLVAAFDTEDYHAQYKAIESEFQQQQSEVMEAVHERARNRNIRIMRTPSGMIFAPMRDGNVIDPTEFEKLPATQQKQIEKDVTEIGAELQAAMQGVPNLIRQMGKKIAELDHQVTRFSVGGVIKDLLDDYSAFPRIVEFLQNVEADLIKNSALIRQVSRQQTQPPIQHGNEIKRRYAINVLVSRQAACAAPVIVEERCSYAQLVGRVEHRAEMGTLTTDFTLIRNGALHRANGGYLILDAQRLLREPFAWDGLKQALSNACIKIESLAAAFSLTTTVALEPEPIPLNLKVALVGDRRLYYLLQALDPEFDNLFKVAADFDDQMDRTTATQREFAHNLAAFAKRKSLHPVAGDAMCRVIEESARSIGDSEKLSTEIRRSEDLLCEGHFWAEKNARNEIAAADIDAAIQSREYRNSRVQERVTEEITRANILIATDGSKVGQINGLAVHQMGNYAFGRPSRISARVSIGNGKVVDIERESELGGSLHSKGVLILSGFIAANYVIDKPLSLAATIAFEQSYSGVDGDSASSAELYALLSAIAKFPLSQSYAVTGSVNQYGDIQAIGGVNEKIEGFFDVCEQRGLSGEQGVLIPSANVKHLMLRQRVVDAVSADKFNIYPISQVDEGLSILTGLDAGKLDDNGDYPSGTLNHLIRAALLEMVNQRQQHSSASNFGNRQ